jgi:hypothetical protein
MRLMAGALRVIPFNPYLHPFPASRGEEITTGAADVGTTPAGCEALRPVRLKNGT